MKNLFRLLPAVLLAIACIYTYRLTSTETYTYPAATVSGLNASTENGTVAVGTAPDSVITVLCEKYAYGRDSADAAKALANVVYSGTIAGDRLTVKAEMPSGPRPYGANFTIAAPESTDLTLSSTNGAITVSNMVGGIEAGTTNGKIALTGTSGAASLSTANGDIEIKVHRGAVEGGTTNGDVDCDVAVLGAAEGVTLETTNGAVTLRLPADVSALVEATTTGAVITILDFTNVDYEVQEEHHVKARIGSGASTISIKTTNGAITIRARS